MAFDAYTVGSRSYSFGTVGAGRIWGITAEAKRGPGIKTEMVKLKAHPDNAGNVYFGAANVSSIEGFPLAAGEDSGWIPVKSINQLYFIMDNATDNVQYFFVV